MSDERTNGQRREFGHVYQRGRVWWLRYSVDGRRHYESSGSTSQRQAEKLLARRQAELGLGQFVEPDVRRTSFEDLAKMLLDDYRVNGRRSLERAQTSVKHLSKHFADARAATITADRVTDYIRQRQEEGAAPATIQNELAALKRAFTLALRARKITHRPYIPRIEAHNARTGFFEEADLRAVLAELPEHLAPVIEFAYLTGWRIPSEALTLRWSQVDFGAGVVRLEPGSTKNREGREFPFDVLPRLEALLREQRRRTTAAEKATGTIIPHVFHRDGKPIRDFRGAWKAALDRAATEEIDGRQVVVRPHLLGRIPHDLRRTAVRNLTRAGVPKVWAKKLTGHKTDSVFDRYDIVEIGELREAVRRLATLHSEAMRPGRVTKGGQSPRGEQIADARAAGT